jgi:DHA1 family bicyclomycin/chloramphenicol resistance-like MFS transporter
VRGLYAINFHRRTDWFSVYSGIGRLCRIGGGHRHGARLFPVEESAKVFSLLILILGVSPLLAPTVGGFITEFVGWKWIFITLALIVSLILATTILWLPQGRPPDRTISLNAKPMLLTFIHILEIPQFYTYTLSGAFSFATLFIYVAGSPVIFMERFGVSPEAYGGIFALLSVGFIGSNQANILALKYFKSHQIFKTGVTFQVMVALLFFVAAWYHWLGLASTVVMFFITLSCLGFIYPNGSALALAPFTKNVGSAAALIGCLQIGVAAFASACVGLFNSSDAIPVTGVMVGTSLISLTILRIGERKIGKSSSPHTGNYES